jgi:hypothetical protein
MRVAVSVHETQVQCMRMNRVETHGRPNLGDNADKAGRASRPRGVYQYPEPVDSLEDGESRVVHLLLELTDRIQHVSSNPRMS